MTSSKKERVLNETMHCCCTLMIVGAGGDLTDMFRMLLNKSSSTDVIIMDYPTECGFITFER